MIVARTAAVAVGAVVVLGATAGAAVAVSGDDDAGDTPITGSALERAARAALAHTGGGEVAGTEVGDEESRYEVEVTRDDGTSVDVQLDERFEVISSGSDEDRDRD